jgi:hypothetical protein
VFPIASRKIERHLIAALSMPHRQPQNLRTIQAIKSPALALQVKPPKLRARRQLPSAVYLIPRRSTPSIASLDFPGPSAALQPA